MTLSSVDSDQLLTRAECESLIKRTLGFATADETRVTVNNDIRGNTRFALNQISTSGYTTNTTVTVRSVFGKRAATITTNKLDDATLAETVRTAETIAKLVAENGELMPELGPQSYSSPTKLQFVVPTAKDRTTAIDAIADRALRQGCDTFGYIEIQSNVLAIGNSRGLFAYDQFGNSAMTVTARTTEGLGSGWSGTTALNWGDIDPAQIGAQAIEKALRSRNPVSVEPGHYTVVLEPTAVGNLVRLIPYAASARAADEGRSFFSKPGGGNKIGMKIVDPRVTITTDPRDSGNRLFTSEGLPAQKVTWIERGIVKNLMYDRYWAERQKTTPTALASFDIRMAGGTQSIPELVANTKRGILVTRFWYIRPVDPRTMLYTGLTRDGTFVIEDGKVTRAARNFRYNDSPIFLLNNIDEIGQAVRVSASEDGGTGSNIIVPAIKAHDFNFTSSSDAI